MASAFQTQLMSLVAEGAFDRYPELRVICVESGFAWLPSFMWRFDRLWRALRREIPWTRRAPAAYLREHVRVTTQPFDAPADAAGFGRMLDQIGSDELLCFATDHPHWQWDAAGRRGPAARRRPRAARDPGRQRRRLYRLGGDDGGETRRRHEPLIDCDVHNALPSDDALQPYMPEEWRERRDALGYLPVAFRQVRENLGDRSYMGAEYPRPRRAPRASTPGRRTAGRRPPTSPSRRRSCSTPGTSRRRCSTRCSASARCSTSSSARCSRSAANDWLAVEWLDREPRFRASIVVAYEDGLGAAAEIDRMAADPRFVQVLVLSRTIEPLGRKRYWPIYEACERHGLPLGIHNGGWGGHPMTPAGFPSYYIEDTAAMALRLPGAGHQPARRGRAARASPGCAVVLIEGGFAWLPALMWRLDRAWRRLRAEVPAARAPAVGADPRALLRLDAADGGDRAAGAVPRAARAARHGRPDHVLDRLPALGLRRARHGAARAAAGGLRRKILHDNAARLYGLGVPAEPAGALGSSSARVDELPPGLAPHRRGRRAARSASSTSAASTSRSATAARTRAARCARACSSAS